jgi:peroxin-7
MAQVTPQGLQLVAAFDTVDGLWDCAWSEANENILASASGDGSIKLWDMQAPPQQNPLRAWREHTREACVACDQHSPVHMLPRSTCCMMAA